jgi:di/tricarboxylate transporter
MDFAFWYTLFLLILMTVFLVKEWFEPELVLAATLLLLVVGKVVTVREAFSGFSNEGLLSIALLFILAGALYNTGALNQLGQVILGKPGGSLRGKLARLMIPVSISSAFVNNTPIVAVLLPVVRGWTEKYGYSPSKFLIPLSYAAILGGMCTLMGTSTTLIVHGMLIDHGMPGLGFFEISRVGVPVALLGIGYLVALGPRLLPERKHPIVELSESTREFVIELKVTPEYPHVGKTVEEAGLRHLKGLFLFQIEREGKLIAPASPEERLRPGDRLFFTGLPKTILELQRTPGLQLIKDSHFDLKRYDASEIRPYEAVVSPSSPLVGKNVRESNFRARYNAVIIAIHRSGERIRKKIGDIVLQPGDTLLVLADRHFRQRWYNSRDFYLISDSVQVPSKPPRQMWLAVGALLGTVLLAAFQILPLLAAAGLAVLGLLVSRTISLHEAQEAMNWRVLILIGCALGISVAIQKSGVGQVLGNGLVRLALPLRTLGVLAAIYFLTSGYTSLISSNATVAIVFPIALAASQALHADFRPFALAITIAAAASFASPIAYPTNLMVFGPGGYRFGDYFRVGILLQVAAGIVLIAVASNRIM